MFLVDEALHQPRVKSSSSNIRYTESVWFLSGQTADQEPVRHIPVDSLPFRIGRRGDVGLRLDYPTISGNHAELLEQGDQLLLRDLASTNGTFVNGRRISQHTLAPGDVI